MSDVNSKNYYQFFQRFFDDTSIDDLLATIEGYQKSKDFIADVTKWVIINTKPDAEYSEFEDLFSRCLLADETLWFNLAWGIGWATGAAQCLKKYLESDTDSSTSCLLGSIAASI